MKALTSSAVVYSCTDCILLVVLKPLHDAKAGGGRGEGLKFLQNDKNMQKQKNDSLVKSSVVYIQLSVTSVSCVSMLFGQTVRQLVTYPVLSIFLKPL